MSSATGHEQQAYLLAAGIVALLISASLAALLLKLRTANGRSHAAIDNLHRRVNSWWIIAAALGLALWGGRTAVTVLFALVSALALREFFMAGVRTHRILYTSSFWVALPLQYLFVWMQWHALFVVFLPLYAVAVQGLGMVLRRRARPLLQGAQDACAGLLLCVYAISHIPALLSLDISGYAGRNVFLLTFLIVITQLSDVLQYVWGNLLGRHPIAPSISPKKTIEGALGGITSATALGVLLAPITPLSATQAGMISLAVTLLGFLGGLLCSAIKRMRGIKDWSNLIPGHGGILDRLDSLVLSAPFFYYLMYFGWAG